MKLNKSETNLKELVDKSDNGESRTIATGATTALSNNPDEYEFLSDSEIVDKNIVKNLGKEDYYDIDEDDRDDDEDDDDDYNFDYNNASDSYSKFIIASNTKNDM